MEVAIRGAFAGNQWGQEWGPEWGDGFVYEKPKRLLTGTAGFAGIQIQIGREHSFGGRSHSACSKESTKKMAPSTNDCLEGPNDPLLSGDFVWPILPG